MDELKLKNFLSNKFNKGLKTSILLAGAVALTNCANPTNTPNGGTTQTQTPPNGNSQTAQISNAELDQGLVSYIFDRHRFAFENENFGTYENNKARAERGNQYYVAMAEFMNDKLNDLRSTVNQDPNADFIRSALTDAFDTQTMYTTLCGYTIEDLIDRNIENYAKPLGEIVYKINNTDDRNKFIVCYNKLAFRAYQDSLGKRKNDQELPGITEEAQINQDLADHGIPNDYQNVEFTMQNLLDDVSRETGVYSSTLTACVNLALYHEGMYGLRDLGHQQGVISEARDEYTIGHGRKIPQRKTNFFENCIINAFSRAKQLDEEQQMGNTL